LFEASNPIPAKAILYKLGKIKSPQLRLPLSAEDMVGIDRLVALDNKIKDWEKSNS
jgi:dihydrodipicolinate synthase/N-acetylneuraminate lyase